MRHPSDSAPVWLFSFVDLAFLMVIAMTQLSSDVKPGAPDLGEMVVPRIGEEATSDLATGAAEVWQLRVHPQADGRDAAEADDGVFELVRAGGAEAGARSEHFVAVAGLRLRLLELAAARAEQPLLAPHRESRSQDLLDAAALIEELWPGRRRVTVARLAGPG